MTRVIREICCCSPPQLVSFGDKQTDRTVWCSDESHEKEKQRAGGYRDRTIESFIHSSIGEVVVVGGSRAEQSRLQS